VTRLASASAAVALVIAVWIVLHLFWYPHGQLVDFPVYEQYGNLMWRHHAVPYRDFRPEYPPAALVTFLIPAALHGLGYPRVFELLMGLCLIGGVLCVLAVAGRRAAALAALSPLLLGSVVIQRFDLWPAALAVAAIAALLRGKPAWSAIALGTGFAAKLWPAALAPLLFVHLWRTRGRRAACTWLGVALATAAVWFVPFAIIAPGGLGHSFYRQLFRPMQIESTGSAVLLAVHHLFGKPMFSDSSFGSQNLNGWGSHTGGIVMSVLEIAALVAVYWTFMRGEASHRRLAIGCVAVVAALIAFGKVFSPQFLIWLIPLAPLVRSWLARGLFLASLVLTQLYFPRDYWNLVISFAQRESAELLLRDLAVVALFCTLTWSLARTERTQPRAAEPHDPSDRGAADEPLSRSGRHERVRHA
jgi:hypothetical protein